jgi:hypothetical protein
VLLRYLVALLKSLLYHANLDVLNKTNQETAVWIKHLHLGLFMQQ